MQRLAAFLTAVICVFVVKSAPAEETLPAGWLQAQVNERGQRCERHAGHVEPARLLVACGPAGVWEVALSEAGPRFVKSYPFSGDVVGFFTEPDGRLWVKLLVLEARPFSGSGTQDTVRFPDESSRAPETKAAAEPEPAAGPASAPPPKAGAAPKRVGRVVKTAPGEVVISLGTADGVMRSDRIELALDHPEDEANGEAALSREALAVGVVTNVTEQSSKVRLGLNEQVPLGALASPSRSQPTNSLLAPPRVTGLWTLELSARPFAALSELGGGFLFGGSLGRRFGNLHLQAVVDPFAFADVQVGEGVNAVNATLIVSYDSQFFEMGLGFGAQTVNAAGFFVPPGSGLALAQLIRLGAQDGLNLSARTSVVLFHSQFDFGGMVASAQIPVTRGYWLLFGGGGGNVGYGYGEFGLRVLLKGNGRAGSKFLSVTAGGAAVFRSSTCQDFSCQDSVLYGGPMAGIGGEWRF